MSHETDNSKMKVFILTAGSYSDYHIHSVWSTKELAQQAQQRIYDPDGEVKIYELDSERTRILSNRERLFTVFMKRDGTVIHVYDWICYDKIEAVPSEPGFHHFKTFYRSEFVWNGIATSQEHAIKICNEKRIQYLARQLAEAIEHKNLT